MLMVMVTYFDCVIFDEVRSISIIELNPKKAFQFTQHIQFNSIGFVYRGNKLQIS